MLLNVTNLQNKDVLGFRQSIRTIPPRKEALNDAFNQLCVGVTANSEFTSGNNLDKLVSRITKFTDHSQIGNLREKLASFVEQIDNRLGRIQDQKLKKD